MRVFGVILFLLALASLNGAMSSDGVNPLSKVNVQSAVAAFNDHAFVKFYPPVFGYGGHTKQLVTVSFHNPTPTDYDWINGVFSPANFSASTCPSENRKVISPLLCTAPVKFQYANQQTPEYTKTGKGKLKLQLINQRSDFSFALFSGGLSNPKLVVVSKTATFENPKAPVYPRLAQGKEWNEVTVTWTSGNHERDWPNTGSFYGNMDSGGECGVVAETMFYVPAENRANFWYSTDYGMFRFCVADTEHDWREGTEQYKFIEHCLSSG